MLPRDKRRHVVYRNRLAVATVEMCHSELTFQGDEFWLLRAELAQ